MKKTDETPVFQDLVDIVARLRAPDGCPWDREQTHETIAPYLLEETHEVLEAIETGDSAHLCEELGDLLLEVALLARISEEAGDFTVADSVRSICEKLIRRHPHVFGDEEAGDHAELRRKWSETKALEKPGRSTLGGVPRSLPALHRARRVSEKAGEVGFDWTDASSVLDKVEEECRELRQALAQGDARASEDEFGDLLFALVNFGRHTGMDAERALQSTTDRFISRFQVVEQGLKAAGSSPTAATMEEMEELWNKAKLLER